MTDEPIKCSCSNGWRRVPRQPWRLEKCFICKGTGKRPPVEVKP